MKKDFLQEYHEKRDFNISSEPFGKMPKNDKKTSIFVIQKHDATNLHYDFRLLVDGVLKSWAVPKGPSTNPKENRLAIKTEDHPIEYADFEGVIPKDKYGGGTVMVWDAGTFKTLKKDEKNKIIPMQRQLQDGRATFVLEGKKLKGAFTLIRTQTGKSEKWILKKVNDDEADARKNPINTQNKSVLTNRTMHQIKKDAEKAD